MNCDTGPQSKKETLAEMRASLDDALALARGPKLLLHDGTGRTLYPLFRSPAGDVEIWAVEGTTLADLNRPDIFDSSGVYWYRGQPKRDSD